MKARGDGSPVPRMYRGSDGVLTTKGAALHAELMRALANKRKQKLGKPSQMKPGTTYYSTKGY